MGKQVEIKKIYSLSPMQEGILFHWLRDKEKNPYVEQAVFTVKGEIDNAILTRSLNEIVARYDVLRTIFNYEELDEPLQIVLKEREFKIDFQDISSFGEYEKEKQLAELKERDLEKGFDLTRDKLMRLHLLKTAPHSYRLIWSFHHIIMDGWCLGIIFKELIDAYVSLKANRSLELIPVTPYWKYIEWLDKQDKEEGLKYWQTYLSGYDRKPFLLKKTGPAQVEKYELKSHTFDIDKDSTAKLKQLAADNRVTLNTVFQVLWGILLQQYGYSDDVVFGAVVSGRSPAIDGIENMVGLFINTIPVRIRTGAGENFAQLLRDVQAGSIESKAYEFSSLAAIQSQSAQKNDLIDHIMVFENFPLFSEKDSKGDGKDTGFKVEEVDFHEQTNYDLNVIIKPGERIIVRFDFNSLIYETNFIKEAAAHFAESIHAAAANTQIVTQAGDFSSGQWMKQILNEFNETRTDHPGEVSLVELFADQAVKKPARVSLTGPGHAQGISDAGEHSLTYSELDDISDHLALILRKKGVTNGSITAIKIERSIEMIVGILGILKAGGAYLPLDSNYPEDRERYIMKDSGAAPLLTNRQTEREIGYGSEVINLHDVVNHKFGKKSKNPGKIHNAKSPAYVLFTSGSMGVPKGVPVRHSAVVNFLDSLNHSFDRTCGPGDMSLSLTNITFDVSVFEFFMPLCFGSCLVILTEDMSVDVVEISKNLVEKSITLAYLPPFFLRDLYELLKFSGAKIYLEKLLVGVEPIPDYMLQNFLELNKSMKIVNGYGPTETTICATVYKYKSRKPDGNHVPIGKPLANTMVMLTDKKSRSATTGIPGELCIAGNGLAVGYLNNPELAAEKFVNEYGIEFYRTGDLARLLPDGNIEFLGRIDDQLKIRGFRIEPGEIKSKLLNHKKVKDALVIDLEDKKGSKYLCAYIVAEDGFSSSHLKEYLNDCLPHYMIPSCFVSLDEFPLTPTGKIDRKSLPLPPELSSRDEEGYVAPVSESEKKMTEIWEQVLDRDHIGIHDNFFMIGGDSIKTIQIAAKLRKIGYTIEMRDIFSHPTVSGLSRYVKKSSRVPEQSFVTGLIPLTPIQEEFFLSRKADEHHFNQAVLLRFCERIEREAVEAIFVRIHEHHDALRITYRNVEDRIEQVNNGPGLSLFLQVFDYRNEKKETAIRLMTTKADEIQEGIDLGKGPLMRLGLFKLKDGDRLLIVVHHLVMDGISWRILFEDIETLYRQHKKGDRMELPPKSDSFKLWARNLAGYAAGKSILEQKAYWTKQAVQDIEKIPTDFPETGLMDNDSISFRFGPAETKKLLTKVNTAFGTEINDILLTGLGQSIKKTFGVKKLLIAVEGHGREEIFADVDISRTVGWFTAIFPVILNLSYDNDLSRQIIEIKETLHQVPEKGTGYGILKYLTPDRERAGIEFKLKPQVRFNYLGQFDADAERLSFDIAQESTGNSVSLRNRRDCELDISGWVSNKRFVISISYDKKQFKTETIEHLSKNYKNNLKRIISYCSVRKERELTPSDLTYKGLSVDYLEELKQRYSIKDIYRLSPLQEGMLFHTLYDIHSSVFFEQISYKFQGELDIGIVNKSLNELIKRHDVLRTVFIYEGVDLPLQVVLKRKEIALQNEDIRHKKGKGEADRYIEAFKEKDIRLSFNLQEEIAIRVAIFRINDREYAFNWSFHHIIMDGWCIGILISEFREIYRSLLEGRSSCLPEVKPYRIYIEWIEKSEKELSRHYWKKYLTNYEETGSIRGKVKKPEEVYRRQDVSLLLDKESTSGLKKLSGRNNVTMNTIVQVAWGLLLSKYTGREDVVFGSVVSGRPSEIEGIEHMVGLFINTIPVRIKYSKQTGFIELLKRVQQSALESEPHHYYSLMRIQAESNLKQNLLDHILVFENYPITEQIEISGKENNDVNDAVHDLKDIQIFEQPNYDFNIAVIPGDQLLVKFIYNKNVHEKDFIERIANQFKCLVEQMIADNEKYIEDYTITPAEEKERILETFNGLKAVIPGDKTIVKIFEEQVVENPGNTAVVFNDQKMSYSKLNEESNRLAHLLRAKGVKRDVIVGLMVERSINMVIGILGVLKAGGAYLPIDPAFPENRVEAMLRDSNITIVLTQSRVLDYFSITLLKNIKSINIEPAVTPLREQIKDFDSLPYPDRTLIDYEKYNRHIGIAMAKHTVSLQATRGCPYNCAYCHKIWPKTHVARSWENIFREICNCYDAGISRFVFIDDIFNLDRKNSTRVLENIIKHHMDVQLFFSSGIRGDILTKDYIDLMIEAGTVNIDVALETASPRMQKLIGKNLNLDRFRENVHYIAEKYPHVMLEMENIIGFPSETEEEALMTLNFIKSIKWLHFPNINILKIYPDTDMYRLALANGVSKESIENSVSLAFHELPQTLPFPADFAREIQSRFLSEYFMLKERLLHVLKHEVENFTEDEIIQKYNSYLPMDIKTFPDILKLADITEAEFGKVNFLPENYREAVNFNRNIRAVFPQKKKQKDAFRILLIDISLVFSSESGSILYEVVEEPLGLMYLMSYLNEKFGKKIYGKVIKSGIDFDSFTELKQVITRLKPHLIGIRTMSYYKDFFHLIVSSIRKWGIRAPIISGGPYATSEYRLMLQDFNIDLAARGEGELIIAELVEKMMANNNTLPDEVSLREIKGIAYIEKSRKLEHKDLNREILLLDDLDDQLAKYPVENPVKINSSSDLVYLVYTSGSTGKPNGVMLEHRNVVNLFEYDFKYTNINFSKVVQFHTISFDASFHEIFGALLSGGILLLVDKEKQRDITALLSYAGDNGVKTLFLPMSLLKVIFSDEAYTRLFPGCVEHIQTAGEPVVISDQFRRFLQENKVYLHNHYGPSETHVVTALTLDPAGHIPEIPSIGKPTLNTDIYIMDKHHRLLPIGVPGELCIGGIQVGRGYAGKTELTAKKFTGNPIAGKKGERVYKTGDLARWLPDGNVEFLGRIDYQVKIRGYRVEPAEIENHLANYKDIKEAVVTIWQDKKEEKHLCAYIICDSELDLTGLRGYLSRFLPDYMIPAYFIRVNHIPQTPNGKVDKNALPEPGAIQVGEYKGPRNEVEKKLTGIWSEVLGVDKDAVSIDSNFFELGGHSLRATILISRIHKEFNIKAQLSEIFDAPTIRGLSEYISGLKGEAFAAIQPVEKREYYTLSSAQKRLYVLQQMDSGGVSQNMLSILRGIDEINKEKLEEICMRIIKRHEVFRTRFPVINDTPVQRITDSAAVDFKVEYYNLYEEQKKQGISKPGLTGDAGGIIDHIIRNFVRPFDLSEAPLLRTGLIEPGIVEGKYILLFDMHHIVSDGTSLTILEREFSTLNEGNELRPLKLQYKDFSEWQNQVFDSGQVKDQEDYWLKTYAGNIPQLELHQDIIEADSGGFEMDKYLFELEPEVAAKFKKTWFKQNKTLYMNLLAVLNVLLYKLTGLEDILVGTTAVGRRHIDLYDIIGFFVNPLVMRNYPRGDKPYAVFLEEVKTNCLAAYENQDMQFEKLLHRLNADGNLPFDSLCRVGLEVNEFSGGNSNKKEQSPTGVKYKKNTLEIYFILFAEESGKGISLGFEYANRYFKKETMKRYADALIKIIKCVTANERIKIEDIEIFTDMEKLNRAVDLEKEKVYSEFDLEF